MELVPKGVEIDIHDRFRKELHRLQLPKEISLSGNKMMVAVAEKLIEKNAPYLEISDSGVRVTLMSLEAYGGRFLESVLGESKEESLFLLTTIPNVAIRGYAERCGLPVVDEDLPEICELLNRIREAQPQTYFALRKSAEKLEPLIRNSKTN